MRLLLHLVSVLVLLTTPALAQGGMSPWQGIAVSQAAEAGLGVCFDSDMKQAVSCAREQCRTESGLGSDDCRADLWCYPHAFAADIFMQHAEGPHWHEFLCGADDRAELDALIAIKCAKEYLIECSAVRIWDTDSNEMLGLVE
jgi:hypothetical protein